MTDVDLQRFLLKVDQLQKMASSLEDVQGRKDELSSCKDHNEVVELARSWGFEIGRRWGELEPASDFQGVENLLREPVPSTGHETNRVLHFGKGWRLELIVSCAACSQENFWYEQEEHEWILILRGSARLRFKKDNHIVDLNVGDQLHLLPYSSHRVEHTDSGSGTIWLALFWDEQL